MSQSNNEVLGALVPGDTLFEYLIERVLGHGGFGITYLARDTHLDKVFAIKEYLPADLAARVDGQTVSTRSIDAAEPFEWAKRKFMDEARVLARFTHPNLIQVHRFFEANGTAYFVMEYAEGTTLHEILLQEGTLPEQRILDILLPIMDGLAIVHQAGVLHRDIKPGNIIIRDNGSPVLIDFGAARQGIGSVTKSLMALTTPGYAPIEQYGTKTAQGPATDLYALGAVAYRLISGEKPPNAIDRLRNDPYIPAIRAGAGRYSDSLLAAVDWALALEAQDRPQSIPEWRAVLEGQAAAPQRKFVDSDTQTVRQSSVAIEHTQAVAASGVLDGLDLRADPTRRTAPPDLAVPARPRLPAAEVPVDPEKLPWAAIVVVSILCIVAAGALFLSLTGQLKGRITTADRTDSGTLKTLNGERAATERGMEPAGAALESDPAIDAGGPAQSAARAGKVSATAEPTRTPPPVAASTAAAEPLAEPAGLRQTSPQAADRTTGTATTAQSVFLPAPPARPKPAPAPTSEIKAKSVATSQPAATPSPAPVPAEPAAAPIDRTAEATVAPARPAVVSTRSARTAAPVVADPPAPRRLATPIQSLARLSQFSDCAVCPEMIVLPTGQFTMGADPGAGVNAWEQPAHRVRVTHPVAIGKYEVTQEEWGACVSRGPCAVTENGPATSQSGKLPVVNVSWNEVQQYLGWLSEHTGRRYRLPSESEWEYAARAGTTTARFWGDDRANQCQFANGADLSAVRRRAGLEPIDCDDGFPALAPVGNFKPNDFGLFDVAGNASELVQDCWTKSYRGAPSDTAPVEAGNCVQRVIRGGGWLSKPEHLRTPARGLTFTYIKSEDLGFRVATDE